MTNRITLAVLLFVATYASVTYSQETAPQAGNEEVARIMREFPGRGELGDDSPPRSPAESLASLIVPADLKVDLVAAEPIIAQPLQISFDAKGRMWVVQYRQYPFPAGLKVVRYDQHLRAVFDKVPAAPPHHVQGADRITVFEDTDGDGTYESHRDVITGLNIATSVAVGHGGIWVLNPPYLLFYPDADMNAEPDADPTVHLSGFGLEDTHSVANSLMFGPDGWLYGVNGSTTTARIVTHLGSQAPLEYAGQCVWRYHPSLHQFEIFGEGGGNPFGLEIDQTGLVFSGTNWGDTRGMHYPQGGYGVKSWGKHGPLTNPYAFGFFNHMPFKGDGRRFTEEFTIYQDEVLPERYQGQLLAVNPLQRIVIASRLFDVGSTFRTEDFESLITTDDRWFRPVDITLGPDGAAYIADWYDTRLTHVDPRDNWHKESGRIYRLTSKSVNQEEANTRFKDILPSRTQFDLTALSTADLVRLLDHPNRWFRLAVTQLISESRPDAVEQLQAILADESDPRQLEALWCLSRLQGSSLFSQHSDRLSQLLHSQQPAVRRWCVRLIGDLPSTDITGLEEALLELVQRESDPRVRSQLASSAKRLDAGVGLSVAVAMIGADLSEDRSDPHIPLLLWWAIESKCDDHAGAIADAFNPDARLWHSSLVRDVILERLARRSILNGTANSFKLVDRLLSAAPSDETRNRLLSGVDAGLADAGAIELSADLQATLARLGANSPHQALVLKLRQGDATATQEAINLVAAGKATPTQRLELIEILGSQRPAEALSALLGRLGDDSVAVRRAALDAIARYDADEVGSRIASAYQSNMDSRTGLRPVAVRVMASRPAWAKQLIAEIDALRIPAELVTPDMVLQMQGHGDQQLSADIERLWGQVRATPEQKLERIAQLRKLVSADGGDFERGKHLFTQHCGKCHKLFGEGGEVGPDLTGYERTNFDFLSLAIVDPSAAIREEFTTYQLLTVDGQLLSGLLIDQSAQAVTLRSAEGQTLRIPRDDIEMLKASAVSLMPENLLDPLDEQQIKDLLSYVSASGFPKSLLDEQR